MIKYLTRALSALFYIYIYLKFVISIIIYKRNKIVVNIVKYMSGTKL